MNEMVVVEEDVINVDVNLKEGRWRGEEWKVDLFSNIYVRSWASFHYA